jgi:hypothetical protein
MPPADPEPITVVATAGEADLHQADPPDTEWTTAVDGARVAPSHATLLDEAITEFAGGRISAATLGRIEAELAARSATPIVVAPPPPQPGPTQTITPPAPKPATRPERTIDGLGLCLAHRRRQCARCLSGSTGTPTATGTVGTPSATKPTGQRTVHPGLIVGAIAAAIATIVFLSLDGGGGGGAGGGSSGALADVAIQVAVNRCGLADSDLTGEAGVRYDYYTEYTVRQSAMMVATMDLDNETGAVYDLLCF